MADEIVQKLKVELDADDAKQESKALGDSVASSMFNAQVAFTAAAKGLSFLTDQISEGAKMAMEYEKTNLALKAALRGAGEEVDNNADALNRQASELQELLGVSDETIREMQTLAINTGVSTGKTKELIIASQAMANTLGRDVKGSMEALLKTQTGLIDRNLKLIPGISDLTKEQLAAGEALNLVNDAWGENATLLSQGYTGQINQLALAWDDLREAIFTSAEGGGIFSGVMEEITVRIKTLTNLIQDEGFLAIFNPQAFQRAAEKARSSGVQVDAPEFTGESTGLMRANAKKTTSTESGDGKKKRGEGFWIGGQFVESNEVKEGMGMFFTLQDEESERKKKQAEDDEAAILRVKQNYDNLMNEHLAGQADYRRELKEKEIAWEWEQEELRSKNLREQSEKRAKNMQKMADTVGGMTADLVGNVVNGFMQMAEGTGVAFDKIIADTMKAMGIRLIVQGLHDILVGTSRAIFSYGIDGSGYALITQGAQETAIGAALAGGGFLVGAMGGGGGGGGGSSAAPPQGVGGGGGTGTGQAPAGGNAPTQSTGPAINVQIFSVGEMSEEQAITIRRGLERQAAKGF